MMRHPKIVVVGGGAAGIAAAMKLLENGFNDIKILEAENRIGGRINSIPFGKSMVDLGAQWCHGETNNVVYEYVNKLNVLETSRNTYKDNTFYDSAGNVVNKEITDALFGVAASVTYDFEMQVRKGSFGDYFIKKYIEMIKKEYGGNKKYLDIANMFIHWFHKLILCYDAPPSWFDESASGILQYKDCEGDPLLNWKDKGYKLFLDILMQKYPESCKTSPIDDKIILNKVVKKIVWNDNYSTEAVIRCHDGSAYNADHVIFTASLGVLKDQFRSMFVPELPFYKINAIEGLGFGTVNKILLKFPHRWWNEEETSFCFLWTEDDRMNILNQFPVGPIKNGRSWLEDINGFYVIDSDPTILMAWMVGEMTSEVEMLDDFIIEKGCMYLLDKFLGDRYEIPCPQNVISSRWHNNSHFRGSYSYKSLEGDRRQIVETDLSEPLLGFEDKPIVLFAGEASHPYYYSTVHGAVETGFREADRLINFYKYTKCGHRNKLRSKY